MVSKRSSWWQQIKQHRIAIGVVAIALMVVIVLIIAGYWFDWTGFNGYYQVTTAHTISGTNAGTVVRTEVYQPGKALWDWLQLLIIPAVLAVGGYLFNYTTSRNEQKATQVRNQTERDIALDNQREAALQEYIDKMSELLLHEKLRESAEDDEVRKIARVRTITILFQLDARRIGYVFAFLREAGLMSTKPDSSIVNLSGADLSKIDLSQADLYQADLSEANLYFANLREADFREANLTRAYLVAADLSNAHLYKADLTRAYLPNANFSNANLYKANLTRANLTRANLSEADLTGADLSEANLSEADLSGANVSTEQLAKAKSLQSATMPDGSKHA